jgi:hypothetical protein
MSGRRTLDIDYNLQKYFNNEWDDAMLLRSDLFMSSFVFNNVCKLTKHTLQSLEVVFKVLRLLCETMPRY